MKPKKNKKKETIEETLKRLNLDTKPEYSINLFNIVIKKDEE
tara:strand:+ start:909 stop:1034 length:126 start_codon:yes stop_codon:yes gene_type:complete